MKSRLIMILGIFVFACRLWSGERMNIRLSESIAFEEWNYGLEGNLKNKELHAIGGIRFKVGSIDSVIICTRIHDIHVDNAVSAKGGLYSIDSLVWIGDSSIAFSGEDEHGRKYSGTFSRKTVDGKFSHSLKIQIQDEARTEIIALTSQKAWEFKGRYLGRVHLGWVNDSKWRRD